MISWLTSRSLFYISKSSKPNGSASPFGEAQFQAPQQRQWAFAKTPRHAPPGTAIQMLLEIPLNEGPHPKRCMKSSPQRSFRQVHQGRPSDNDKFCMDLFLQAQASRPKPAGQREVWESLWYIRPALSAPTIPRLQLSFFVVGSAFVGTSSSVGRTRQSKIPCFGKNPTPFDFFEKDVSLWLEQRERKLDSWDALVEETIDSLLPLFFFREIDQRYSEIIAPPTLPWPCSESQLLGILEMSPPLTPKRLRLSTIPTLLASTFLAVPRQLCDIKDHV